MRVLLVTDRWDDEGGGRERYAADIVDALNRLGCRFDVFCMHVGHAARHSHCAIRIFKGPQPFAELQLRRAAAARRRTDSACPILALLPLPEATHYQLHTGLYELAFAAERESLDSTLRRRFHPLGTTLNPRRRRRLVLERRMLIGQGTRLMAFSNAVARDVAFRFAPHPGRLTTTPIGIDLERFHPAAAANIGGAQPAAKGLRLLFAGHNFVLKGLPHVIAAMGRLRNQGPRVELAVAGRGDTAAMRRGARRARVEDAVSFLGSIPQDELAGHYRANDGLVHPSFYDPFPRSVLEAMACGCPVVTTERCGTSELMTNGVEGWLVDDPRNHHALAEAMAALADRDRRNRMASAAASTARAFRFADHAERVRDWLAQPPLPEVPS